MNRVSDINRSLLIPQIVVAPVQITVEYASSNEASDDYDNNSMQEDSFRFDTHQNIYTIVDVMCFKKKKDTKLTTTNCDQKFIWF